MFTRFAIICFVLMVGICFVLSAGNAFATTVQLGVTIDTTNQTWTATALASDANQLGLDGWSIDVKGIGGVNVLKAAVASQTNQTPAGVYSQLRTTGTISGSDLLHIHAGQDFIDAVNFHDDSAQSTGGTPELGS